MLKNCLTTKDINKIDKSISDKKPATAKAQQLALKQEELFDKAMKNSSLTDKIKGLNKKARITAIQSEIEKSGIKVPRKKVNRMLTVVEKVEKGGIPKPIVKPVIKPVIPKAPEVKPIAPVEPIAPVAPGITFTPAKTLDEALEKWKEFGDKNPLFHSTMNAKKKLQAMNTVNQQMHNLKPWVRGRKINRFSFGDGDHNWSGLSSGSGTMKNNHVRLHFKTSYIDPAAREKFYGALKKNRWVVHNNNAAVILRHEMGHTMWFDANSFTSSKLKKEFTNQFNLFGKKLIDKNISEYATTNSVEFFADTFAVYSSPEFVAGSLNKVFGEGFEELMEKILGGGAKKKVISKTVKAIKPMKPMTSVGKMVNCIIKQFTLDNIFGIEEVLAEYGTYARPDPCKDYVRSDTELRIKDNYPLKKVWYRNGKKVSGKELERLKGMNIPQSWNNAIVSSNINADLQAIGQAANDKWQYQYSAKHWVEADLKKFNRNKVFTKKISDIRKGMDAGLKIDTPQAYLLSIEDRTAIRIGTNADLKAQIKAYGLTTLENQHVIIEGNTAIFDFMAKERIAAHYELTDKKLVSWLKKRKEQSVFGEKLFPDVSANKLNTYLKRVSKDNFTVKDFRTYHATQIAYKELKPYAGMSLNAKEKKALIDGVCETVSNFLHNSPPMAKASYISPSVWEVIGGLPKKAVKVTIKN